MNLNLIEHKRKINQEADLEFCGIYICLIRGKKLIID